MAAGLAGRPLFSSASPGWLVRWWIPELVTAALFALAGWRFGLSVELFLVCFVTALGVSLSVVDIAVHSLPNLLTLPAFALGAAYLVLVSAFRSDWGPLLRGGVGVVVFLAVFGILWVAGGMGLGDVKLSATLGLALGWFGWPELIGGLVLTFVYGGVLSAVLLLARVVGRRTRIAFGPFMVAGAVTAFLAGDWLTAVASFV